MVRPLFNFYWVFFNFSSQHFEADGSGILGANDFGVRLGLSKVMSTISDSSVNKNTLVDLCR